MNTPLHVLIVEDRQDDVELMVHALQEAGFDPRWTRVETAEDFLIRLDPAVDIVLADYNLPRFSGPQALRLLQERGLDIPFIVVTGSISEEVAVECIRHGASDYLIKDRLARLGSAVVHALEQKRLRDTKRRAETALRESEERFRLLVENVKDYAIVLLDAQGRVDSWNTGAERITGYKAEDILGQHVSRFYPQEGSDSGRAESSLNRAAEAGQFQDEGWRVRQDRSRFWAEEALTALSDETGHLRGFSMVTHDITKRWQAEETIKASLREKEVLLREIHHRVKNNLQVICSLLNLQFEYIKDEQARHLLGEIQKRIKSMALVHEQLCRSSNLAKINLKEYVQRLAADLFAAYGVRPADVALDVAGDDVLVGIETAVPFSLIVHELVSNSLKHAFPSGRKGAIRVSLREDADRRLSVTIGDDGVGLPRDLDYRNAESLGLKLVSALTSQLYGAIERIAAVGTAFKISFVELQYKQRS